LPTEADTLSKVVNPEVISNINVAKEKMRAFYDCIFDGR